MKKQILGIVLMLVFVLSIGSQVKCATSVLYDDTWGTWTAFGSGITSSVDTTTYYYGTSSLKIVTTGASTAYGVWKTLTGNPQDWTSYDMINFFVKPGFSGQQLRLYASDTDWTSYYKYTYTTTGTNWQLVSVPFSSFSVGTGSPNWNHIEQVAILTEQATACTYYIDYYWLSNNDSMYLTVVDPLYAVVTPVVGSHAYVEGQPVQCSATMLVDYTFVKFSFYPISATTSNPAWTLMTENQTLTTVVMVPVADPQTLSQGNTDLILYIFGLTVCLIMSVFGFLKFKIFGLLFPLIGILSTYIFSTIGTNTIDAQFTMMINLLFMALMVASGVKVFTGSRRGL